MIKLRLLVVVMMMASALSACTTLQGGFSHDSDRVAQEFFNNLQKSDTQAAYDLFAKGLSQTVSSGQFDELITSMKDQWGGIVDEQTAVLPFHKRVGEVNFIPLGVSGEQIKRYVFEVSFDRATINCDLTLVLEEDQYKIVWVSFWGSSVYLTPEIQEKLENLTKSDQE